MKHWIASSLATTVLIWISGSVYLSIKVTGQSTEFTLKQNNDQDKLEGGTSIRVRLHDHFVPDRDSFSRLEFII